LLFLKGAEAILAQPQAANTAFTGAEFFYTEMDTIAVRRTSTGPQLVKNSCAGAWSVSGWATLPAGSRANPAISATRITLIIGCCFFVQEVIMAMSSLSLSLSMCVQLLHCYNKLSPEMC
jgi:hypothetical protein